MTVNTGGKEQVLIEQLQARVKQLEAIKKGMLHDFAVILAETNRITESSKRIRKYTTIGKEPPE